MNWRCFTNLCLKYSCDAMLKIFFVSILFIRKFFFFLCSNCTLSSSLQILCCPVHVFSSNKRKTLTTFGKTKPKRQQKETPTQIVWFVKPNQYFSNKELNFTTNNIAFYFNITGGLEHINLFFNAIVIRLAACTTEQGSNDWPRYHSGDATWQPITGQKSLQTWRQD